MKTRSGARCVFSSSCKLASTSLSVTDASLATLSYGSQIMNIPDRLKDEEIVNRVRQGETALYEVLFQRYNQRLYRIARAILRSDSEAKDVVQNTYAEAYEHLGQFAGRAKFSTWLTTIAVHEASLRRRQRNRLGQLDEVDSDKGRVAVLGPPPRSPEEEAAAAESLRTLESAIDALPQKYGIVLVMRDVEEMTTAETAECLKITEQNVNVRLYRGRVLLRRRLFELFGARASEIFRFHLSRCDRVVQGALQLMLPHPLGCAGTRYYWSNYCAAPLTDEYAGWPTFA